MGCGCKNKGNQTPSTQQSNSQQMPAQNTGVQTESIKASIKKTIEKYYNVNKTSSNKR